MNQKTKSFGKWLNLLIALTLLLGVRQARAQSGVELLNARASHHFGADITFEAQIKSSVEIMEVNLLFRKVGEQTTRVEKVERDQAGNVSYRFDASQKVFPPFSYIEFWYQVTMLDGSAFASDPISYFYSDNRFTWRDTSEGPIIVHWYDGDDVFARAALDAAGRGLIGMKEIVPLVLDKPVDIYIYSTVDDLKGALELGGHEWIGAHADPALGIVMVAIKPGGRQNVEMEMELPHELTHVMMYRSLGDGYARLPAWFREGTAAMMEIYPNADYAQALKIASENGSVIPISELCASFPTDAGSAFLAYAESQSFTTYLRDTYGVTRFHDLTVAYADGKSCEVGATYAIGEPLSSLERDWGQSVLGQDAAAVATSRMAPYLILLGLIMLVPLWGAFEWIRRGRRGR